MNLVLTEAMSILDLWQALEPVFSRSGGFSAGAAANAGGGPPQRNVLARLPGGIPAGKWNRRHPQRSQYHYWDTQSTIVVSEKGYSAKLTHISRTHTGSTCIG